MKVIHWILGSLILLFNWLFTPRSIKRDADLQSAINTATKKLTLYQYNACPFCVKVRRSMKRNALNIQTNDAKRCQQSRDELVAGGGKLKVPCLKIEDEQGGHQWMYDSSEIISYLEGRFAKTL